LGGQTCSKLAKLAFIMTNLNLWLSQTQFFLSLSFFSIFLAIEIGLAWVLLFFKIGASFSARAGWTDAYRFWVRVFALAVILTLASSMPVLIQVGSLWPALMDKIGDVAGPLLAGAILTTFIFKSCFLGAMLFGQRYVSERIHTVLVLMVAVGVTAAAGWLTVLLAWMQAPAGALLVDGQYAAVEWGDIVLNPFAGWMFGLLLVVAALTAAFLLMGVSVRQAFRHPLVEGEHLAFRTGLFAAMAGVVALAVAVAGYGQQVALHQPGKAAATAAYWHSGVQPDLVLAAWPDQARGVNHAALLWHHAGGRWLSHDDKGVPIGLDRISGMAPPVALTFWSFRLVLAAWLAMAVLAWGTFWRLRKRQYDPGVLSKTWRRFVAGMTFSGWVLGLAIMCHMLFGLAPYAVNGTITLAEIVGDTSPNVLMAGLAAYVLVYAVLLYGFFQLLTHIVRYGVVPIARRRGRA